MDEYGLLKAEFSEEMEVILDFDTIDDTVLEFSIETEDLDNTAMRIFNW